MTQNSYIQALLLGAGIGLPFVIFGNAIGLGLWEIVVAAGGFFTSLITGLDILAKKS